MRGFLSFRTMVAPGFIQAIFFLGTVLLVLGGILLALSQGGLALVGALAAIVALRIVCEVLIVLFNIHAALQDLRAELAPGQVEG